MLTLVKPCSHSHFSLTAANNLEFVKVTKKETPILKLIIYIDRGKLIFIDLNRWRRSRFHPINYYISLYCSMYMHTWWFDWWKTRSGLWNVWHVLAQLRLAFEWLAATYEWHNIDNAHWRLSIQFHDVAYSDLTPLWFSPECVFILFLAPIWSLIRFIYKSEFRSSCMFWYNGRHLI